MAKSLFPPMTIHIRRRLSGGRALTVPCTMFVLRKSDMPEAERMYESVVHGLGPDMFARASSEELARTVNGGGFMVGVRHEDRIVCLRSVITEKSWTREIAENWKLESIEPSDIAMTGFCVVERDFRGNNVQYLSYFYTENIISNNYKAIYTTVAPKNIFSLQNILAYGFTIIGIEKVYSGSLRYVMRKSFAPGSTLWTREHLQAPLSDLNMQKEALKAGLRGYKLIRSGRGFRLLFGKERPL